MASRGSAQSDRYIQQQGRHGGPNRSQPCCAFPDSIPVALMRGSLARARRWVDGKKRLSFPRYPYFLKIRTFFFLLSSKTANRAPKLLLFYRRASPLIRPSPAQPSPAQLSRWLQLVSFTYVDVAHLCVKVDVLVVFLGWFGLVWFGMSG